VTTWLILPTYNEGDNLQPFVEAVLDELAAAAPDGHRVLVVDGASPDGTGALADRLAARHPDRLQVLHEPVKRGLGPAYLDGFDVALRAGARRLLEMDCDFSHDPGDLRALLGTDADLVLGSRYVPGGGVAHWGAARRVVSRGGSWYARRVLGVDVRDLTGGFKCFRREVLEAIDLPGVRSRGYAFQVELTYRALRAGFDVREVPIVFNERRAGQSKMSTRIALEAAWLVPAMRLRAARRNGGPPSLHFV
jgi:dolichol-phosphate mannosyltransferase